jgi:hypothetical protein
VRSLLLLVAVSVALAQTDDVFDAARRGDVAAVRAALDKGAPVDATWRYGQTALFIAAGRGHTDVVRLLLERGAKADVKDSFYGMTALGGAAEKGNTEIVTMLLDKGAPGAEQLLLMAAGTGKAPLVKALAGRQGISPKILTQALASAEAGNHAEAAEALRAAGAQAGAPVDPAAFLRFRGKYATVPHGREVLSVEPKGALLAVIGESMTMEFRALDETTFEPAKYPGMEQLEFIIENGTVTGMESRQASRTVRYKLLEDSK